LADFLLYFHAKYSNFTAQGCRTGPPAYVACSSIHGSWN
jgi:hypothetical protein